MTGLLSIYLDIFRFLAAVGVFLSHAQEHSGAYGVLPVVYFDHKLVVIFFVISGYVIAASASRPDRTLANYSADRLARLSSVVIPALFLTYLLDAIGSRVSPEVYAGLDPHWQWARLLINLAYCQQIWFLCVNPSSNAPCWSLGYEFWYYALFGVWVFVRNISTKTVLLLLVCAFIGPKILLLMPGWIFGAIAFHAGKKYHWSCATSLVLFVVTALATVITLLYAEQLGLGNGKAEGYPLYYSSNYKGDNIFALIVSFHFLCCAMLSRHIVKNLEPYKAVKFIRWAASHTFSLYLYHMPILYFIRAIGRYNVNSLAQVIGAAVVALLIIAWLSKMTEERYPLLRTLLRKWMVTLRGKLHATTV